MTLTLKTPDNISISRLCDAFSFAPILASAHAQEWGHLYKNWNRELALADFEMEKAGSDLPTTWVIHQPSGPPMGSISLVKDDLPGYPTLNPWLASLYVFPEFRGRGLGKLLVQQAMDFLRRQKYPHAYLFTEDQVPFFSKFGFSIHAPAQANGHPVTIMKWTDSVAPALRAR
ncbi:MAG: GNAT family N-acetyltransferase [Verrucomicrobiota bacterium]